MVSVFGDDSADETKQRVFAVAAVIAKEDEWERIQNEWIARTRGVPFHATDCESNQGIYSEFSDAENKKLYKDLVQILVRSKAWGFGAALDIVGFKKWYSDVPGELSYYKAFYETIAKLAYVAKDIFKDEVRFVFDSRLESNFTAGVIYDAMTNTASLIDGLRLFNEIEFYPASKNPKIQAGDLYAREVMKELDNQIGPVKRPRRRSMDALVKTKRFGCDLFLEDYFRDMRQGTAALENEDKTFNRKLYLEWITKLRLPDTLQNRFKFLAFVSANEKKKS